MEFKICPKCQQQKNASLGFFPPDKRAKSGLASLCRACQSIANKNWKSRNPEKNKEIIKAWRARNLEREATRLKMARLKNPQAARDRVRKSYWKNVEKRRAERRLYGKTNPDKVRQHAATRRARKMQATTGCVDYGFILKRDAGICHICKLPVIPSERSFDHVIPLCKGGHHSNENISLSHLKCNLKKGTKLL